ncbi:type II secretion system protein [Noviherbaspirillum soli]|uniref:type II secretion system protein n=1 Tax=Noviherbaspirillum soli TaxID=1064518 RepID=UPI00188D02B1|nr:type II secretion system protein [Noviherbaspirillum soli]
MRLHQAGKRRGFTLIELLLTLAILAVMSSLVLPLAQISSQRVREQALRQALWQIRHALDEHKRAVDEGRVAREAGTSGYPKSLDVLVKGVPDQRDPGRRKIYFLRRVPPDPMQNNPEGSASASWGKRSYASEAADPQEGDDVYDVYSTAPGTGLNGIPYRNW